MPVASTVSVLPRSRASHTRSTRHPILKIRNSPPLQVLHLLQNSAARTQPCIPVSAKMSAITPGFATSKARDVQALPNTSCCTREIHASQTPLSLSLPVSLQQFCDQHLKMFAVHTPFDRHVQSILPGLQVSLSICTTTDEPTCEQNISAASNTFSGISVTIISSGASALASLSFLPLALSTVSTVTSPFPFHVSSCASPYVPQNHIVFQCLPLFSSSASWI